MAEQNSLGGLPSLSADALRKLDAANRLMKAVEGALITAELPIQKLTVAANAEGMVSLFGVTASEATVRRAGEVTETVPGVVHVLNTIVVVAEQAAAPDRSGD